MALLWLGVTTPSPWPPPSSLHTELPDGPVDDGFEFDARGLLTAHTQTRLTSRTRRTYQSNDAGRRISETLERTADDEPAAREAWSYRFAPFDGGEHVETYRSFDDGGWVLESSEHVFFEGRVVRVVNERGETRWEYDRQGRPISVVSSTSTLRYAWDPLGRLDSVRLTGAEPARFQRDDAGTRVLELRGSTAAKTWQLASDGQPESFESPRFSASTRYRYDDDRRLIELISDVGGAVTHTSYQYEKAQLSRWLAEAPWCDSSADPTRH